MFKQNINIVGIPTLNDILEEINNILSFKTTNFNNIDDFLNLVDVEGKNKSNIHLITPLINKDFFIKKKFLNKKNIFFFCQKNIQVDIDTDYNILRYPMDINVLIEKINIQLIKNKYNFQSKLKVKNYFIDLNSRTISNNNNTLKLTEREIDIIFFLNENKDPQKINDLQNKVWRYSSDLETHTVETHIYRLRKKMYDYFKDKKFIISTDKGYFIEKK